MGATRRRVPHPMDGIDPAPDSVHQFLTTPASRADARQVARYLPERKLSFFNTKLSLFICWLFLILSRELDPD